MSKEEYYIEVRKRRELTDYYYDNFRKAYGTKDLSKASEFLWGALNTVVYALGLFSGEKLSEHSKVVKFVAELANSLKDKEIGDQLAAAQTIHANFFHNFMDELTFEVQKEKTIKLVEKLVRILDEKIRQLPPGTL